VPEKEKEKASSPRRNTPDPCSSGMQTLEISPD